MLRQSVEECLRLIAARDGELRAWVEVSPQPPLADGRLSGVPFGAKDIIETRGMATEFGSPIFAGRKGERDAAIITQLRGQGAVLMGKTHTTAFAYFDPAPTRNPRDPARTPGGSSSGSAAAVAAGMVAFALGSQTLGSIVRPASYCGVTGFKPTFGLLPLDGVMPFAPSLDTLGYFTRTAADMRELVGLAAGVSGWRVLSRFSGAPELDDTVARLRAGGFTVLEVDPPEGFAKLDPAARLIQDYEGARTHEEIWRRHGERIGRKLAGLVERGLATPAAPYQAALDTVARMRSVMAEFFRAHPIVLTPASVGPAPLGLASTGDPRMNSPWTALHVPAISVPMPVGDGLPFGLQMTAAHGCDATLLETAVRVESCWSAS